MAENSNGGGNGNGNGNGNESEDSSLLQKFKDNIAPTKDDLKRERKRAEDAITQLLELRGEAAASSEKAVAHLANLQSLVDSAEAVLESGKQSAEVASGAAKATADASAGYERLKAAGAALVTSLANGFFAVYLSDRDSELRIIASYTEPTVQSTSEKSGHWTVNGVVTHKGVPTKETSVLVVLLDEYGNEFTSGAGETNAEGAFSAKVLQSWTSKTVPKITEVQISSWVEGLFAPTQHARHRLYPDPESKSAKKAAEKAGSALLKASARPFVAALTIFSFSILIALFQTKTAWLLGAKYYTSVILAVAFTGTMFYFIAILLSLTSDYTSQSKKKSISLGFAYIHYGKYASDVPNEWLVSLTSSSVSGSSQADNEPRVVTVPPDTGEKTASAKAWSIGMGAPLWVVLLSVVGAGFYTVKLIFDDMQKPIAFAQKAVSARVAAVLINQFSTLFAPLGALILYQMLLAAGGASRMVTVGLVGLASGLALTPLLDRAWKTTSGLVSSGKV